MSYKPKVVTTNQLSDRLDVLEETNSKLSQWLRLKIKQIDELDKKVNNNLEDVEIRKVVQKLSDDFYSIQNTTVNSKTIDVMINTKMDSINKNVKGFSELIENKLINKITKLEEYCNSKFKILDSLVSRVDFLESTFQKVPTAEDLSVFSKQFSDRLDKFESKLKTLEESTESQINNLHKKFSDELPLIDDINKLDEGINQKFEKIENFVSNLTVQLKTEIESIKTEMESIRIDYSARDSIFVSETESVSPVTQDENEPVTESDIEKTESPKTEELEFTEPKRKNKKKGKGKGK